MKILTTLRLKILSLLFLMLKMLKLLLTTSSCCFCRKTSSPLYNSFSSSTIRRILEGKRRWYIQSSTSTAASLANFMAVWLSGCLAVWHCLHTHCLHIHCLHTHCLHTHCLQTHCLHIQCLHTTFSTYTLSTYQLFTYTLSTYTLYKFENIGFELSVTLFVSLSVTIQLKKDILEESVWNFH